MSTPLALLERVVDVLSRQPSGTCTYALVGGLAASLYRRRPRVTNDVDIALVAGTDEESRSCAENVLRGAGLELALGWIPDPSKKLSRPIALIIGREPNDPNGATVDILLPVMPWLRQAVDRAQYLQVDFGFAKIPTIALEDLIVAKLFALSIEPERFQDLDDLKDIFSTYPESVVGQCDYSYVASTLDSLGITVAGPIVRVLPGALKRFAG